MNVRQNLVDDWTAKLADVSRKAGSDGGRFVLSENALCSLIGCGLWQLTRASTVAADTLLVLPPPPCAATSDLRLNALAGFRVEQCKRLASMWSMSQQIGLMFADMLRLAGNRAIGKLDGWPATRDGYHNRVSCWMARR